MPRTLAILAALLIVLSTTAAAQDNGPDPALPAAAAAAWPVAPEVMSRDGAGNIFIRAVRVNGALRTDGRLDEEVYGSPSITGFIQHQPEHGQQATERTEAWVMFDDDFLYVSGRCWDSSPPDQWIANELRRDTTQLRQNDNFAVLLDTFHDRRNAYMFYTNPVGALADYLVTDEGNPNLDWNPVWTVRTGRFEGGWTVEMAIPFKSLRYESGSTQTWGIQLRRMIRRKNEWTYLTPLPVGLQTTTAIFRVSSAATLVGLETPGASRNLELKPYAISRLTTDRVRTPALSNDPDGDIGIDVKYGVTANLTADVTVNTDFAQVEVDEQQVNLTRFSLVYPEKRDFFLEGRGTFEFGRGGTSSGGDTPQLFYSRRIGLDSAGGLSRVVPIEAGARLTGKVGNVALGLLNIQTGDEGASPSANFTVLRVKSDILRRSSVGAMFTNRSATPGLASWNRAYGVDAVFSFFENVSSGWYLAGTSTPNRQGEIVNDISYQGRFEYGADRYGLRLEHLHVGENFRPEVGFARRLDFSRSAATARFSPRPRSMPRVRKFTWEGTVVYLENGEGQLESRNQSGRFNVEFNTSDQLSVEVTRDFERLENQFRISGITIPAGSYTFSDVSAAYAFGQQRPVSGTVQLQRGRYYDGTITAFAVSGARVSLNTRLSLEPAVAVNRVERAAGGFTQTVVRARSDYAFSPRMFASGLLQYNSTDRIWSSNLRFRWEYFPGSELFVVYTDEHNTELRGFQGLRNRAFVVKMNRLFRI